MQIRRPLCLAALIFVLTVMALVYAGNPVPPSFDELEGNTLTLTGQVSRIEYRLQQPYQSPWQKTEQSGGQAGQAAGSVLRMVLTLREVTLPGQPSGYQVLCYFKEEAPEPKIGQWVRLRGRFQQFSRATNPGEFDSRSYYQILNLSFRIKDSEILTASGQYAHYQNQLYQIRKKMASALDAAFPATDAAVLKTMLLGDKSTLDADSKNLYQDSGIIHILAISGLHISIIGMGFYRLLKKMRLPLLPSAFFCVLLIFSYGLMTGLGASSLRAIAMFAVHLLGELLGRAYDLITALCLMAILMLLQQPLWVLHSGFLLSFGAIMAIGIFLPAWQELWELPETQMTGKQTTGKQTTGKQTTGKQTTGKQTAGKQICEKIQAGIGQGREALLTGSAVSLVTLPVLLWFYYVFPPYSLLLNLVVIPLMTIVVIDGISVMAIGQAVIWIGKTAVALSRLAGVPDQVILGLYAFCSRFSLQLPGARMILGRPQPWQILVYYLILTAVLVFHRRIPVLCSRMALAGAVLLLCLHTQTGLYLHFLDVGQGDGIVIEQAEGGCYLVDGGSTTKTDVGTYQILPFLKSRGIAELAAILLSHPDEDHINGAIQVLEQADANGVRVDALVLPAVTESLRDTELLQLRTTAKMHGVPVRYLKRGDCLQDGRLTLTCLNPKEGIITDDINEASEVLLLQYGKFTSLLTGDVTGTAEQEVISELRKMTGWQGMTGQLDVLKVAHHGSQHSTPSDLLELCRPRLAVISSGKDNRYGHPHPELLQRLQEAGVPYRNTQQSGAITVHTDGRRTEVEQFTE